MKNFIKFIMLSLFVTGFSVMVEAQTYIERNVAGKIKRYVKTTKDTTITADNIAIVNGEAGIIRVQVAGINDEAAESITGELQYRYSKTGGTLTLTPSVIVDSVRAIGSISAATFAATSSGNNIKINVTGVSGKTIRWAIATKQWAWVNSQ